MHMPFWSVLVAGRQQVTAHIVRSLSPKWKIQIQPSSWYTTRCSGYLGSEYVENSLFLSLCLSNTFFFKNNQEGRPYSHFYYVAEDTHTSEKAVLFPWITCSDHSGKFYQQCRLCFKPTKIQYQWG